MSSWQLPSSLSPPSKPHRSTSTLEAYLNSALETPLLLINAVTSWSAQQGYRILAPYVPILRVANSSSPTQSQTLPGLSTRFMPWFSQVHPHQILTQVPPADFHIRQIMGYAKSLETWLRVLYRPSRAHGEVVLDRSTFLRMLM